MQKSQFNLGTGGRPFPDARQSAALCEEDAFMHLHGGSGSRLLNGIVNAFSAVGDLARRCATASNRISIKKPGPARAIPFGTST